MAGNYTRKEDEGAKHLPSQDEIRRKCLEIQARWGSYERVRRTAGAYRHKIVEVLPPPEQFGE